jgi:uncharacterized protein involved in exopolysaccharide biosynthesis
VFVEGGSKVTKHEYCKLSEKLARYLLFLQAMVKRVGDDNARGNKFMTLLVELKEELRKTEQARKEFETKVSTLRQKETRIRQLAAEISGRFGTRS